MTYLAHWARTWLNDISLDAAGLIALTDLTTIARRTALTGGASYADALTICPGIHKQGLAVKLHTGEYPICANMNSGYVFRVENQGTVQYLQRVGETGCLVTLRVTPDDDPFQHIRWFIDLSGPANSALLYLLVMVLTLFALAFMLVIEDYWGFSILLALVLSRFIMVISIKRRCSADWHGASEPGVHGSLLVLLSQDRWVRIDGMVDDLKAVTSGQWLRDTGFTEEIIEGVASTSVYACAALGTNATQIGKLLIGLLLIVNAGLLALSNYIRKSQYMKDRVIRKVGGAKPYKRRLELAYELIEEFDRDDWAVKMGMILEPVSKEWLRARSGKDRKVQC